MAELMIAALTAGLVTYGLSAVSKLRGRRAYRAFRDGFGALGLVRRPLTSPAAAALAGGEALVAALCATGLIVVFATGRGGLAGPAAVLAGTALAAATALTAVLTAGVAVALHRGVTAPCACFGATSRAPLGAVQLTRNACLLVAFLAGVAGTAVSAGGSVRPAAAVLAVAVGGVSALLVTRLDELAALFGPAVR